MSGAEYGQRAHEERYQAVVLAVARDAREPDGRRVRERRQAEREQPIPREEDDA